MYSIKLANGDRYDAMWCGEADGILSAQLATEERIDALAAAFADAGATAEITFEYGEMIDTFAGYTRLIMVQDMRWGGGHVLIQLRREPG